jgi:MSHA pilin protein MshD
MNKLKPRHCGFTLVELIISMVVISIALVGIFKVIILTSSSSSNPVVQYQAIAIAESYMEEISLQAYCDPILNTTCTFAMGVGPDAGETRATYNDVDDYNGLIDTGAHDKQGNAIPSLSSYTISVTVIEDYGTTGLQEKLMTVNVTGPATPSLALKSYAFLN